MNEVEICVKSLQSQVCHGKQSEHIIINKEDKNNLITTSSTNEIQSKGITQNTDPKYSLALEETLKLEDTDVITENSVSKPISRPEDPLVFVPTTRCTSKASEDLVPDSTDHNDEVGQIQ